jgi:hypothetical protein
VTYTLWLSAVGQQRTAPPVPTTQALLLLAMGLSGLLVRDARSFPDVQHTALLQLSMRTLRLHALLQHSTPSLHTPRYTYSIPVLPLRCTAVPPCTANPTLYPESYPAPTRLLYAAGRSPSVHSPRLHCAPTLLCTLSSQRISLPKEWWTL